MASMKESVFVMAKWLNLQMMQEQYKSAFKKMADSGNLSKGMKDEKWKELLDRAEPDPDDQAQNDVFMDADEWEKLYKEFLKTFRALDDSRDSLKEAGNKDAIKYLDLVYGTGNYFYPRRTDDAVVNKIKQLFVFFESPGGKNIGEYLLRQIGIEKTSDISDFIGKIKKGKYDTDADLKYKLENLIRNAKWLVSDDNQYNAPSDVVKNEFQRIGLQDIQDGLDDKNEQIPPAKINDFKTIYPVLLRPLLTKEKIRNAFASAGGGKITEQVNRALEKTNYKDENSADFVAPSEKDTLTWQQQLEKDWKDFKDDTILKLKNRAKYDKYLMPEISKPIAVEIYDAGWKPEDGLEKLKDKKSKIEGKFKGKKPESAKAFKFLMEVLEYAESKIPKAFAGALKNGKQGLALDIFIAEYGLKNGKSDAEISAAHEVLSKLRWGYNTSVKRDKIFKEPLVLFGDKGLSWNKQSEGMRIVSNATDKTINFMLKSTFNIFNAGINAVRRYGRYYKLNNSEQDRIDKINQGIDGKISEQQTLRSNIITERDNLRNARNPHLTALRNLHGAGFNRAARAQAETDIQASNQLLEQLEQQKENENTSLAQLQDQQQQIQSQIQDLQNQIQQLTWQQQVFQLHKHQAQQQGDLAAEAQADALLQQASQDINAINTNIGRLNNQLGLINPRINTAMTHIGTLNTQITNETNRIQPTRDQANQYDDALENLRNLNSSIGGLNESIRMIDEDINKLEDKEKKRFLNLMATRNMMNGEGGYVKNKNPLSLLFGSQKNIQNDFNNNKDALKQQYIAQYWANQGVSIAA